MPDFLDQVRDEMQQRIAVLAPAVEEHARLQRALEALSDDKLGAPSAPRRAAAPARARARKGRSSRAPHGENRRLVLEAVGSHPGASATELAELSGVNRSVVYGLVAELSKTGELKKVKQDGRRPGYEIANAPSVKAPQPEPEPEAESEGQPESESQREPEPQAAQTPAVADAAPAA